MMESCNTAEQTSKILLDAHFPGSTEMGQIHPTCNQVDIHPTCNQVDINAAKLERDTDILHYQYKTVLDKNLDDLSFLNPNKVKEAFNNMNSYNAGGPDKMKSIVFQNIPHNILIRISKIKDKLA